MYVSSIESSQCASAVTKYATSIKHIKTNCINCYLVKSLLTFVYIKMCCIKQCAPVGTVFLSFHYSLTITTMKQENILYWELWLCKCFFYWALLQFHLAFARNLLSVVVLYMQLHGLLPTMHYRIERANCIKMEQVQHDLMSTIMLYNTFTIFTNEMD